MFRRTVAYSLLIITLVFTSTLLHVYYRNIKMITTIGHIQHTSYWLRVVLLPLDSRPPCTQYLEMLGEVSGIKVILPPKEIMDNYRTPANRDALSEWLKVEAKNADAAIVSVDMLTHGSLLASRLSLGGVADSQAAIELIKIIHAENKNLKIYAFNIIPRLLLADSKENTAYQKNVLKYSVLKDQLYTFENPLDSDKLVKLEDQIPQPILNRYNQMYQQNIRVNTELADLTEKRIITALVIGQDDGQPFGIPNINKLQIARYTHSLNHNTDIMITRGTDEVALTLLGKIITDFTQKKPNVFVMYSDEEAPRVIMPYMPNTVATTVKEKLNLVGAVETTNIENADFILYVHIGTTKNVHNLPNMAKQLKRLIENGYKVALVDLSENYYASQTLFPELLKNGASITSLTAYAGWNTTSNSVGTAVTQALIFNDSLNRYQTDKDLLRLYQNNLELLIARFLDDWYFQKDVQHHINTYLKDRQADPYNLDNIYDQTNHLTNIMMQSRAAALQRDSLDRHPIYIRTQNGTKQLYITGMNMVSYLPWTRTFEIFVKPNLSFGLYEDQ